MVRTKQWLILLFALILGLSGCVTNPVTGEREIGLVSESSELAIGKEQYQPSRQMQGGDYNLQPKLTEYVQQVGARLAAVSDRKLPYEFVIINDSTPNAWALPGGKIGVHRGLLLELENEAQLAAVLAHEIVHAAARHGAKGIERGMLLKGALVAAGVATRGRDYSRLAVGAASLGANLVNRGYSRSAELEADSYGMRYMARAGYDPRAAIKLQETFVRLAKDKRSNWLSGLFASHPPSPERVAKNRESAKKLGSAGELGRVRYQKMIARLKRSKKAYFAHQSGLKFLAKKQSRRALSEAQKALREEPDEALFFALKGDALLQMGKREQALSAYDAAISRNANFFGHYLQRGKVRQLLGDSSGARHDLRRSIDLLPTATAHHLMGQQYAKQGERNKAITHLKLAASSSSPEGNAATKTLVKLDLADNPQRYIRLQVRADKRGLVILQLKNLTPVKVAGVRVILGQLDTFGKLRNVHKYRLSGSLGGGKSVAIKTDIRVTDRKQLAGLGGRVTAARVR